MIKFKRDFPWIERTASKNLRTQKSASEPLREFVYLDEVSLGSLLASQKGEITENITSQAGDAHTAEVGGKVSTNNPILPSAEVNSRFQTTNSSSLQTLRKATAQSLFRELYRLPELRKIYPIDDLAEADSLDCLLSDDFAGGVHDASGLRRGDLVEFKVKLSASWIFQISSMVAEFSDIFDESPALFIEHVRFSELYQARNANKIVNKLLAGLIPVDGVVSDYVVVRDGSSKHIAHKSAVRKLNAELSPLRIVGVTEHLAYWKDIRRILFANNEFTMLCRLSKDGIQDNWNPIKVADIFKEFAPDLAKQIEVSSRTAMLQSVYGKTEEPVDPSTAKLAIALVRYKDRLLERVDQSLEENQLSDLDRAIASIRVDGATAEGQRSAFATVRTIVENLTGLTIDPSTDLDLRESLRKSLDMPLFPQSLNGAPQTAMLAESEHPLEEANLLDVEVVAIYW